MHPKYIRAPPERGRAASENRAILHNTPRKSIRTRKTVAGIPSRQRAFGDALAGSVAFALRHVAHGLTMRRMQAASSSRFEFVNPKRRRAASNRTSARFTERSLT
jgi:hypothetical protein